MRLAFPQTELRYALHETREERHLPQLEAMTERLHTITLDLQRLNAVPEVSPPSPLPPPPPSSPPASEAIVVAEAEKEQRERAEGQSKQLSLRAAAAAPTPAEARITALEERLARGEEGMEPELGAKLTALEARLETLAAKAYAGVSAVDRKADRLRRALRENSSSRSRGGGGSSREAMVEREQAERRR